MVDKARCAQKQDRRAVDCFRNPEPVRRAQFFAELFRERGARDRRQQQDRKIPQQQAQRFRADEAVAEIKEVAEESEKRTRFCKIEESPAEDNDQEGIDVLEKRGELFEKAREDEFFENQDQPVIEPPEQEVIGSAVPETGQPPDDQQIEDLTLRAAPVAAERDIDVFAEPD